MTGETPDRQSSLQGIREGLVAMGLTEDESRTYTHLLTLGPSKVRTISETAGLERAKTYRTLSDLEGRGFVTASLERPTRYTAEPPQDVLDALVEVQRERLLEIERLRGELEPTLTRLADSKDGNVGNQLRVLDSREAAHRRAYQMMQDAKERIDAVSTHQAASQMGEATGIAELAMGRIQEGIAFRSVTLDTPEARAKLAQMPELEGVQARLTETDDMLRFLIVDGAELLVWAQTDPSDRIKAQGDVAIWTDAPDLVRTQLTLFESLWGQATIP